MEKRWLASFIKIIASRQPKKLMCCSLTALQVIRIRIWDVSRRFNNCYRNEREVTDLNVGLNSPTRDSFLVLSYC